MKNLFTKSFLIFSLLFIFSKNNAQIFPYNLVTETDTYTDLQGATVLTGVGDFWDDPNFSDIPLGFNFEFFGNVYTTLILDDFFLGGMLTFNDLDDSESSPILIAYIDDLMDVENSDENIQSTISHKTEGSAGSQVFKMEWNNCGFFNEISDSSSIDNIINFQLWIYEATGNIEMRFGPSTLPEPGIIHDFGSPIIGMANEFFGYDETFDRFWFATGPIDAPTVDTIATIDDLYTAQGFTSEPEDGRVFRFENIDLNIFSPKKELEVKVYPSVVVDEFYVEVSQEVLSKNTQLVILNNLGQTVFSKRITDVKEQLDASIFPKGIYYVSIANEEGRGTQKIVKN